MPSSLSLQKFIIFSIVLHLSFVGLLILQSKNLEGPGIAFETQVFFDKGENTDKELEQRKQSNFKKKVPANIPSKPKEKGILKANKNKVKQLESSGSTGNGDSNTNSGLKNFTRNWKKRNQLKAYKSVLAKIVGENWILPPVSKKKFEILIETIIRSDGSLSKIGYVDKTDLVVLDSAAMRAIQSSIPFPEFLKFNITEEKSIRVVFRFTPETIDN